MGTKRISNPSILIFLSPWQHRGRHQEEYECWNLENDIRASLTLPARVWSQVSRQQDELNRAGYLSSKNTIHCRSLQAQKRAFFTSSLSCGNTTLCHTSLVTLSRLYVHLSRHYSVCRHIPAFGSTFSALVRKPDKPLNHGR